MTSPAPLSLNPNDWMVFTYWEGPVMPFINQLCVASVARVFGSRHRHLGPEDLPGMGIIIPPHIEAVANRWVKFDYLRCALLQRCAGWWFDCDILLFHSPLPEIATGHHRQWEQEARVGCSTYGLYAQTPNPIRENAVLFAHQPNSCWMNQVVEGFMRQKRYNKKIHWAGALLVDNSAVAINQQVAAGTLPEREKIEWGHFAAFFNNTEWWWDWVGKSSFNPDRAGQYGISLYTYSIHQGRSINGYHRAKDPYQISQQIMAIRNANELLAQFPASILAEYIRRYH